MGRLAGRRAPGIGRPGPEAGRWLGPPGRGTKGTSGDAGSVPARSRWAQPPRAAAGPGRTINLAAISCHQRGWPSHHLKPCERGPWLAGLGLAENEASAGWRNSACPPGPIPASAPAAGRGLIQAHPGRAGAARLRSWRTLALLQQPFARPHAHRPAALHPLHIEGAAGTSLVPASIRHGLGATDSARHRLRCHRLRRPGVSKRGWNGGASHSQRPGTRLGADSEATTRLPARAKMREGSAPLPPCPQPTQRTTSSIKASRDGGPDPQGARPPTGAPRKPSLLPRMHEGPKGERGKYAEALRNYEKAAQARRRPERPRGFHPYKTWPCVRTSNGDHQKALDTHDAGPSNSQRQHGPGSQQHGGDPSNPTWSPWLRNGRQPMSRTAASPRAAEFCGKDDHGGSENNYNRGPRNMA